MVVCSRSGQVQQIPLLDVDATRLMIGTLTSRRSSEGDIGELHSIFDSLEIVPQGDVPLHTSGRPPTRVDSLRRFGARWLRGDLDLDRHPWERMRRVVPLGHRERKSAAEDRPEVDDVVAVRIREQDAADGRRRERPVELAAD